MNLWLSFFLFVVVAALAQSPVLSQGDSMTEATGTSPTEMPPPTGSQVGDVGCVEGFIMDYYCIQLGRLLDNRSIRTLEGPDQHSVHCLVDVPQCHQSPFEVLLDPTANSLDGRYTRGWRLDDAGKEVVLRLARQSGSMVGCTTCTAELDTQRRGFRTAIVGTILDEGSGDTPATISVQSATPGATCVELGYDEMLMPPQGEKGVVTGEGSLDRVIYIHASLMLVGWGFLLPLGGVLPRLFKQPGSTMWFTLHVILQPVGLILTIVGFGVALYNFDAFADQSSDTTYSYEHAVLGVVTMVLGLVQPFNAILRPHPPASPDEAKSSARIIWEWIHRSIGWLALILAVATIVLGTTLLPDPDDEILFQRVYGFGLGGMVAILVGVYLVLRSRGQASSSTGKEQKEVTEQEQVNA